jgi:uncharacterized protein YdeI (YjbR/CyaY-like superfamily)
MQPTFFATPDEFRAWLAEHHGQATELLVGFYKKGSGKPSMTWPEAVDAALCFGWIDGVRKRVDGLRYTIRFTPRKPRSTWSDVNVKRVAELEALGLMQPAGRQAFAARVETRSGIYSHEQKHDVELDGLYAQTLRANGPAWEFFQAQPPWYRRAAGWWVTSAKKDETRQKRLATLIDDSANHRTLSHLTRPRKFD